MAAELKVTGVTANCGNQTIGATATTQLIHLLDQNDADMVVINCQEVDLEKQIKELEVASGSKYGVASTSLMVTYTKPSTLLGNTGIATFVLYNRSKINAASFDPSTRQEVRGENKNKGGFINTLVVTANDETLHRVQTISGHLDSNSDKKRANDWQNLKRSNAFTADNWDELANKAPELQIAGYDANTRDLWIEGAPQSMWQQSTLDSRIASMAMAPLGTDLYSADNTYNTELAAKKGIGQDKKRKEYAKAGSLDFVAMQNNTQPPITGASGSQRYTNAPINIGQESGTERDHNVVAGTATKLTSVSNFERVRNYMVAELSQAAPTLSGEIAQLNDTEANQRLLVALHNAYLSPTGRLVSQIKLDEKTTPDVKPWFQADTLAKFQQEYLSQQQSDVRRDNLRNVKKDLDKAFDPKRTFSTKTQYVVPHTKFQQTYEAYQATLQNMQPPSIPTRKEVETLNQQHLNLLDTLQGLQATTQDKNKIASLQTFKSALDQIHTAMLVRIDQTAPTVSVVKEPLSASKGEPMEEQSSTPESIPFESQEINASEIEPSSPEPGVDPRTLTTRFRESVHTLRNTDKEPNIENTEEETARPTQ